MENKVIENAAIADRAIAHHRRKAATAPGKLEWRKTSQPRSDLFSGMVDGLHGISVFFWEEIMRSYRSGWLGGQRCAGGSRNRRLEDATSWDEVLVMHGRIDPIHICIFNESPHPKLSGGLARRKLVSLRLIPFRLILVLLLTLLASCARERGLLLVEDPASLSWQDDGSAPGLTRSIDRSISFYRGQPAHARFVYGDLSYSPREMIASMELFKEMLSGPPAEESLAERLARMFHIFESVSPEERGNLFTGYYEPELEAGETPSGYLNTPIYPLPPDIVKVELRRFGSSLPPRTLMGRLMEGELVPYYSRREIQDKNALTEKTPPIAFVNEVDLFFLQIQGSGILRFSDGRRLKVGYAASNGHPYKSIGALLVRRGEMLLEEINMQSIRAYLAENTERARALLYANPSYIFFQVREEGPLGNIRVPLTPGRSLALDRRLFAKGGLAYVITTVPEPFTEGAFRAFRRFMLVQDTGGAIKGHGRGDLFFGSGAEAEWKAGHQKNSGRLLFLVAKKEFLSEKSAE